MQRVFSTVALAGVVAANEMFEVRKSEINSPPTTERQHHDQKFTRSRCFLN